MHSSSANQVLEQYLVRSDAAALLNLVVNPRYRSIMPSAILALQPFWAAFLYESIRRTTSQTAGSSPSFASQLSSLRATRMQIKLLDGDPRTLAQQLNNAEEMVGTIRQSFRSHTGLLALIKNRLQPDVGLSLLDGQIVNTTHVALSNLGVTVEDLRNSSYGDISSILSERARLNGNDLFTVAAGLGVSEAHLPQELKQGPKPPNLQYKDLRSESLYKHFSRSTAVPSNGNGVLIMSVLSAINTALSLAPLLVQYYEATAFKIRFVTLFHATQRMQWMLNNHYSVPYLTTSAKIAFENALASRSVRRIRKHRNLRNILVHYQVNPKYKLSLDHALPMLGLVEAQGRSTTYDKMCDDIEAGLNDISSALSSLLPAFRPQGTL